MTGYGRREAKKMRIALVLAFVGIIVFAGLIVRDDWDR